MPVSVTEKPMTVPARPSACEASWKPSGAGSIRSETLPSSVNLTAFESRFFSTCWRRCSSVNTVGGTSGPAVSTVSSRPFSSASGRNVRST